MAVFAYRALDARRAAIHGFVSADSARQAREVLRSRGLLVQDINPHAARAAGLRFQLPFRNNRSQLGSTIRELSTLLSVGVPLVEALATVTQQQRGAMQNALLAVRDRVAAGAGLAEAMSEQPHVFDELTQRMVEVGENAGNLDVVLDQVADFKERSLVLKDRMIGAILYPTIVFGASVLVTVFLMTVVVPMLLTNLLESGRVLPWPTRVLKAMSDLLLTQGWWLAFVCALLTILLASIAKTRRGRLLWHRLLLRLPLFGSMASKQTISRIAMVLATLMRSGIVYAQSAEIAAKACKNLVFRDAILRSNEEIRAGQDIGAALSQTKVFPPLVIHLITVGQASGKLEDMLERLATNYDRQVTSLAARLAAILEPVLILFLAVVVGFILLATLLPILEAGNVLA